MKHLYFLCVVFVFLFAGYALSQGSNKEHNLTPVDYVNPYMGNISHLLVPTYPTIHLPNSMLRVYIPNGVIIQVVNYMDCRSSLPAIGALRPLTLVLAKESRYSRS